ncbi:MAG TPA: NAD(P)H-binding protein [Usitatibacteraceae bacterium]
MNIILFGASGMVGQGVLRECLRDADVQNVLIIGRSTSGRQHAKLREIVHANLADYSAIASQLSGYDACFFCLGVSSAGMPEAEYSRITYDFTIAAAETLVKLNPGMTFIYVSGASTDSSERGGSMWARVKGKTENALLRLPFKAAYMFRPGAIRPLHGIKSKTRSYRILYGLMAPLMPALNAWFPKYVTTTEKLGRAMLRVAKVGSNKQILENLDINRV